jgi:HEAT repeat protein
MAEGGVSAADVAAFLEQGLLSELVTLFRAERTLYGLLGELLRDERIGVRLGASALVEELAVSDPQGRGEAAAALAPLLAEGAALLRGDGAYLLGVVADDGALPGLRALAEADPNREVREIAAEAVERITSRRG